jgi:hypothetical protein
VPIRAIRGKKLPPLRLCLLPSTSRFCFLQSAVCSLPFYFSLAQKFPLTRTCTSVYYTLTHTAVPARRESLFGNLSLSSKPSAHARTCFLHFLAVAGVAPIPTFLAALHMLRAAKSGHKSLDFVTHSIHSIRGFPSNSNFAPVKTKTSGRAHWDPRKTCQKSMALARLPRRTLAPRLCAFAIVTKAASFLSRHRDPCQRPQVCVG